MPEMVDKIAAIIKAGGYMRVTYLTKDGVELTQFLLAKDVIQSEGELELVLSNGALLPLAQIREIRPFAEECKPDQLRKSISPEEIVQYQLSN